MFRSPEIYIDLGTSNTLIYVRGKGFVLNEPSFIATKKNALGQEEVHAVGTMAKLLRGKTRDHVSVIQPLKEGVIANFDHTVHMLRGFLGKLRSHLLWMKPSMLISMPCQVTPSERQALTEVAHALGAKKVSLIEEPIAAALGAGIPVLKPQANLVVDIGGGTTEIAVTACGGIVHSSGVRVGGNHMDERIQWHLKSKYNFVVGEETAELLKIELAQASPAKEARLFEVGGLNLFTGLPTRQAFTSEQISEAIREPVNQIVAAVKASLENVEGEVAGDIAEHGITLAGGGALLTGIAERLELETGVKVRLADDPLRSIARGGAQALEDKELLERIEV